MSRRCNHITRVRITDGKRPDYLCIRCGDRWTAGRNGKVPIAPRRWQQMNQGDLAVWYARIVIKAKI